MTKDNLFSAGSFEPQPEIKSAQKTRQKQDKNKTKNEV